MKYLKIFCLTILAMMSLFSCQNKNNVKSHDDAHELFMKSMYLTQEYIDSIDHATDSTTLKRVIEGFNNKITNINYQFPPDTDLDLSEEENDSLIRMFKRLDSSIEKSWQRINNPNLADSTLIVPTESLEPNDSIRTN